MKTISSLTKNLALASLAIGVTTSLLSAGQAKAVSLIKLNISAVEVGAASAPNTVTGNLVYDQHTETVESFFFTTTAEPTSSVSETFTFDSNGGGISPGTGPGNPNSTTELFFQNNNSTTGPAAILGLRFDLDLTTLNPGEIITLLTPNTLGGTSSLTSYQTNTSDFSNLQFAGLINDTPIEVAAVPEPLTILGTLVAGGVGVAMKKRKKIQQN